MRVLMSMLLQLSERISTCIFLLLQMVSALPKPVIDKIIVMELLILCKITLKYADAETNVGFFACSVNRESMYMLNFARVKRRFPLKENRQ